MKHEVRERQTNAERSETYSGENAEFFYGVNIRADGFVSVYASPLNWDRMRMGAFQCHPKNVSDLDRLADGLPDILRTIATELRAVGLEDLRSGMDKRMDEMNAEREKRYAEILKGSRQKD
jgi:hypothetical protein